jgi:DNA repair protein RadB
MKLRTLCGPLDDMLEGGLEPDAITLVYGEPASGKTNLCLQLARSAALLGLKTVYVDTEGVSLERFRQICGDDFDRVLPNVLFYAPRTLEEQGTAIEQAVRLPECGLVVVDSFNQFYRLEMSEDQDKAARMLLRQLSTLQVTARTTRTPVILTGQVYGSTDNALMPFGSRTMEHIVKTILEFRKVSPGKRSATLKKHRALPEGKGTEFRITGSGLE